MWHWAFWPQRPGQGSLHLLLIHALLFGHSELPTHSGLQLGGCPIKLSIQEQIAFSPSTLQLAFRPHGDGIHGFSISFGGGRASTKLKLIKEMDLI